MAVKLPAELVIELRHAYPGQVRPARPLDQRFWVTEPSPTARSGSCSPCPIARSSPACPGAAAPSITRATPCDPASASGSADRAGSCCQRLLQHPGADRVLAVVAAQDRALAGPGDCHR